MADPVQVLQKLGFGDYEARAYVALLQRSPLSGYELAKLSGIPRANVYTILPRLEERGAVVRVDTPSGTRYAAIPPSELAGQLSARFHDDLASASASLEALAAPVDHEYVWNTEGFEVLIDQARALIDAARERLLLAIWPSDSPLLASYISRASSRGVQVTTLCLAACPNECGSCQGTIFRYHIAPEYSKRWLLVVQDNSEVLAGEIAEGNEAVAVRSRQRLIVEMAAWYVRHGAALAAVMADLGSGLSDLLSPDTLSVLSALGPDEMSPNSKESGWLGYLQHATNRRMKGGATN